MLHSIVDALKTLEQHRIDEAKNLGDVGSLAMSNPFISAILQWIVAEVTKTIRTDLENQLPSRDLELFGYADVAQIMKKSVGTVRQMKARGQIVPARHNIRGKAYFTRESVMKAIREMEQREGEASEERKRNMKTVRIDKPKAV
jgi:hypothetical protein